MSDTEAKPEEGNEPITIRVKDQTGAFCFYIVDNFVDMLCHVNWVKKKNDVWVHNII